MKYRVWAEISQGRLEANCRRLIKMVGDVRHLMIVCKANAYGHDDAITLEVAKKVGVTRLGVGDSSEALNLRKLGWEHQILVLGSLIDEEVISIMEKNIDITVHSVEKLMFLDRLARELDKTLKVHIKVDTGMGRFGTGRSQVVEMAQKLKDSSHLIWAGLCTHFASPRDTEYSQMQLDAFEETIKALEPLPHTVDIHSSASLAYLNFQQSRYDFVRCGLSVYGIDDSIEFDPVLSLYSQIIFIKDVAKGSRIGYTGEFVCERPTRLAIIPIGYYDGFRFAFSNNSYLIVNGQRAPVVGRVSMDYTTLDITDISEVHVGDKVTLIGEDSGDKLTVSHWARLAQCTPHEITCLLGNRVKRVATS